MNLWEKVCPRLRIRRGVRHFLLFLLALLPATRFFFSTCLLICLRLALGKSENQRKCANLSKKATTKMC